MPTTCLFISFNTFTRKLRTRLLTCRFWVDVFCNTVLSYLHLFLCQHLYSVGLLTNHLFSLHTCNLRNILNATSLTLLVCITYCPSICGLSNILHSSPKASYLTKHSLWTSSISLALFHQQYNSQPSSLLILQPPSFMLIMLTCNEPSPWTRLVIVRVNSYWLHKTANDHIMVVFSWIKTIDENLIQTVQSN